MPDTVIRVENLGKKYTIGHQQQGERYTALRDVIANGAKGIAGRFGSGKGKKQDSTSEDFWALKDISFEIKQGDRVGIIGRNGAGKSTLLKVLSRITEPTKGKVHIRGRIASLLEVGTGFHPELTGRENVYLNGAILGMRKTEIFRKFDEIVAFAEVEKFLDTPVKRYSSGMYVRLAFAVAAHLEPEILIVDEVLAVGDVAFQKKCLGKMEDVGKQGRTVLFVSHNIATVEQLCSKTLLLNQGDLVFEGSTDEGISLYAERINQLQSTETNASAYSDSHLMGLSNPSVELVKTEKASDLYVNVTVDCLRPTQGVGVALTITTQTGNRVVSIGPRLHRQMLPSFEGKMVQRFHFPSVDTVLAGGDYLISLQLVRPKVESIVRLEHVLKFELTPKILYPGGAPFVGSDFGSVMLKPYIYIEEAGCEAKFLSPMIS